jgi:hypothetical protein
MFVMLRYFTTNIRKESDANIGKFRRLVPSEEAATTSKEGVVNKRAPHVVDTTFSQKRNDLCSLIHSLTFANKTALTH